MNKASFYCDFDGVINFFGSRNKYGKHKDVFGYVKRNSRMDHNIDWSAALASKMNSLRNLYGYDFVWHSSWTRDMMSVFGPLVDITADDFLDWDADSGFSYISTPVPVINALRDARKYAKLLDVIAADPHPFVWVDDTATGLYNPDDFTGFGIPHLIIKTDGDVGLTKTDFAAITDFFAALGND
jgi:hypothetical protein